VEFEEEEDKDNGDADYREIDPEDPTPSDVLSEATTSSTGQQAGRRVTRKVLTYLELDRRRFQSPT
jgi:hypothetical protein